MITQSSKKEKRKGLRAKKGMLCFRMDGGKHLGMGHLFKCMILVRALRRHDFSQPIICFIKKDEKGIAWLKKHKIPFRVIPKDVSRSGEPDWILGQISEDVKATFLLDIVDVGENYIRKFKKHPSTWKVITLENQSPSKKIADLAINALVDGPKNLKTINRENLFLQGSRYRIFHPDYKKVSLRQRNRTSNKGCRKIKVLISLGGGTSDRQVGYLINKLLKSNSNLEAKFIKGPAQEKLNFSEKDFKNRLKIVESPSSLARLLIHSDFAVTAGGGTLYETAYMGIPSLAFAKNTHQRRNIHYFNAKGSTIDGGVFNKRNIIKAIRKINEILSDSKKLSDMSRAGKEIVDGGGLERVVRLIKSSVYKRGN